MRTEYKKIIWTYYATIAVVLVMLAVSLGSLLEPVNFTVYFFDVLQGDSSLIITPQKQKILIDGGGNNLVLQKLGLTLPYFDRQIDLMIVTHPHSDHYYGLIEVLRRYEVKKVWLPMVSVNQPAYDIFLAEIKKRGIVVEYVAWPQEVLLTQDIRLQILAPNEVWPKVPPKNLNNTSIVARLTYASTSLIFMGDYENEESLAKIKDLKSEILKVGHHGSGNANDPEFIKAVNCRLAVISVAEKNQYNLPNQAVVEQIKNSGCEVFLTSNTGDLAWEIEAGELKKKPDNWLAKIKKIL